VAGGGEEEEEGGAIRVGISIALIGATRDAWGAENLIITQPNMQ
jgi:hypothetical protein